MAKLNYSNSLIELGKRFNFEKEEKTKFPFFKLDRTKKLMDLLGNPQDDSSFTIHIAGTNGKGTVSSIIDSIISKDYKTGLLTSPHLKNYTERIKINGKEISQKLFASTYEYVSKKIHNFEKEEGMEFTFFEVITAMAFVIFKNESVNVKILETGLGGTFDSTNIVNSDISVITSISEDHKKILGGTLKSIAENKAGIIKNNSKVIISKQKKICKEILINVANSKKSDLIEVKYKTYGKPKIVRNRMAIKLSVDKINYNINYKSVGSYHIENIATAIKTVKEFNPNTSAETITKGINKNLWPCRGDLNLINEKLILIDGAHNKDGFKNLKKTLETLLNNKKYIFIYGTNNNHDVNTFIKFILEVPSKVILTKSNHPKSLPIKVIENKLTKLGIKFIKSV
ncbi:MAG: Mur ligase family protein, partial [Chloroflexota bacterium]|nr:Mur ligase family protein [Chloroflexota bacterium]